VRVADVRAKSFFTVAVSTAIAAFTVSACGSSNSTITATGSQAGVTAFEVVTSDGTAISALKGSPHGGATLQDGDQHTGNHICGFSVSKNGHSYQVDWYSNSSALTSALLCSSSAQQQFLSAAP
jgi:hypothetical protein